MIHRASSSIDLTARLVLLVFLYSFCLTVISVGADELETGKKAALVSRETNPIHFVRLVVQRLIYGIATMIGLGDAAEEVADGALVPPGADDYGFGLEGADNKDYDDDDDEYRDDADSGANGYDDYLY